MSTFYPYDLTCPTCQHQFRVELVAGVHITRLPHARQEILNGTFQVFQCPSCGAATAVEASLVYTDFDRGHYVAMESAARLNWQAAHMRHQAIFEDCFVAAPPIAREMGRKMKKRVVFGLRALREKLLLWDAGLDDYVVEAVKGDLAGQLEVPPTGVVFRLSRILPGGHLMFACITPTPRPPVPDGQPVQVPTPATVDFETVPADRYQRRLNNRGQISAAYPWLQDDWFVDIHDGPAYLYK